MRQQPHYRGGFEFTGLLKLLRELRKSQTSAEGLLWELVRDRRVLGFKFRRQHQIGRYVVDFYCREAQLIIECDGGVHDRNDQWQHDRSRDLYLTQLGNRVVRFKNDQVLSNTETVLEEIASLLLR